MTTMKISLKTSRNAHHQTKYSSLKSTHHLTHCFTWLRRYEWDYRLRWDERLCAWHVWTVGLNRKSSMKIVSPPAFVEKDSGGFVSNNGVKNRFVWLKVFSKTIRIITLLCIHRTSSNFKSSSRNYVVVNRNTSRRANEVFSPMSCYLESITILSQPINRRPPSKI